MASADVSAEVLAGAADPGVRRACGALRRSRSSGAAADPAGSQPQPETSPETRRAVAAHGEKLTCAWQPLFEGALGAAAPTRDLVRYAFLTLRGYLQGGIISAHIADIADDAVPRRLLIEESPPRSRRRPARQGIQIG